MTTNDLKKGAHIILRNGFEATIEDNKKGNIRLVRTKALHGAVDEMGSVYSHDIVEYVNDIGIHCRIEHTSKQKNLKEEVKALFGD